MLTTYRPFSMIKDLNQALDEFWNYDVQKTVDYFSTISQDDSNYHLKMIVPGFKKEEINIEVKNGILIVIAKHNDEKTEKVETKSFRTTTSFFENKFKLPKNINVDSAKAEYKSGILIVTFEKSNVQESSKKINVSCSE